MDFCWTDCTTGKQVWVLFGTPYWLKKALRSIIATSGNAVSKTLLCSCACTPPHGAFKAIRDALLSFSIIRVPARARISSLWRQDLCSIKPLEVNILCPERNQRPDGRTAVFPSCGYWDIRILLRSLLFRFYYVPLFIQNLFYAFILLQYILHPYFARIWYVRINPYYY